MRNLKTQLLVSHMALVALMILVMSGAVLSFLHLGRSIDRILVNNYKSVAAMQSMKDALDWQDRAALLYLAGQKAEAKTESGESNLRFERAYYIQDHNITEPGERTLTDEIGSLYRDYRSAIDGLLMSAANGATVSPSQYYFRILEPAHAQLRQRVEAVLALNEKAMMRADNRARAEARNASLTGIGLTIGASLIAFIYAFRMVHAALSPLRSLAQQAEQIGLGHLDQRIDLKRSDEIGALAGSFNHMAERLREAWREEEERLHRAERMSDAAVENPYDPIIVTDSTGRIVHLNRAAEGLFGPAKSASGMQVAEVVEDARIGKAVDRAIHHEHVSAEEDEAGLVTLRSGNVERTYRLRVTPMHDDLSVLLGAVAVLEDVTHLRELDRLKSEFIGVASHELRTPVTSLLLSSQLLQEGAAGALTRDQQEILSAQWEDLQRFERLTRDLLDLARLEAGITPPIFAGVPARRLV